MTLPDIRRVVTGLDAHGASVFIEDASAAVVRVIEQRPGYRVTNVWCTAEAPATADAPDAIAGHQGVAPPKGGTVLRIIDFPPEPKDPKELERMLQATFGSMYRDAHHAPRTGEHPGMHRTDTVDYAIMLEGEMVAIVEQGETTLRAGDVLIQRATRHAWANRSGQAARIAFVLIDAGQQGVAP